MATKNLVESQLDALRQVVDRCIDKLFTNNVPGLVCSVINLNPPDAEKQDPILITLDKSGGRWQLHYAEAVDGKSGYSDSIPLFELPLEKRIPLISQLDFGKLFDDLNDSLANNQAVMVGTLAPTIEQCELWLNPQRQLAK